MKIFTLSVVFCLFTILNLSAQWVQQTAPGTIFYLNSINFTNGNSGITTGWGIDSQTPETTSRAFYTTNGGTTWNAATVPDSSRVIVATKYISPMIVYATGAINIFNENVFSRNTDRFKINGTPIDIHSRGIDFSIGAFFKSTDGGRSWKKYGTMPEDCYYVTYSDFIDANTGMAIGSIVDSNANVQTNILKTTNGGLTWVKLLNDEVVRDLVHINFINSNLAFAIGVAYNGTQEVSAIMRTTNGGLNWTTTTNDTNRYKKSIFINTTTGFVAGNDIAGAIILKTTDQGITWNKIYSRDSCIMEGLNFNGENGVGIAYGEKYFGGNIYKPFVMRTSNLGQTWTSQTINEASNDVSLTSSSMVDNNTYYISGGTFAEGRIYHTRNGGSTIAENNVRSISNGFSLSQNFPNPFNPETIIRFNIPEKNQVTLKVYNGVGKEILELVNEIKTYGAHEVKFNAGNLPSGIYFYTLTSGSFSETKKMILIK